MAAATCGDLPGVLLDAEPRRIALVRARTGLGDLLCGVPALRALRARLPDARITMVGFAETAPVLARQAAYVDELLALPGWPGIPERPVRADELPGFLEAARERRFDVALQVYGANPAANVLTAALGAAVTGGFVVPGATPDPDLVTHLPYPHHLHEVDRHLALLEHLGAPPVDGGHLELPLHPEDEQEAAALGLEPGRYALVHPGATSPSRRWPAERFAAVREGLEADGLEVLVTGTPGERELVGAVGGRAVTGLSLGGFAALVRDAALLVGSDTGATHVAAATGTPSVTAFLSGDPRRFGHAGRGPHRVARVQVACNPCHHLSCPIDHRCATALTAAEVLAHARAALAAGPHRPRPDRAPGTHAARARGA
jgi:ADP-heptose:LPS heptosyltransferase